MVTKICKIVKDNNIHTGYNSIQVKAGEIRKINFKSPLHYDNLVKVGALTKANVELVEPILDKRLTAKEASIAEVVRKESINILESPNDQILNARIRAIRGKV